MAINQAAKTVRLEHAQISLAIFAATLAAILIAFYWIWLSGQASFYVFDFTYGWEPYLRYIGGQLALAHWPLWNPLVVAGVPQIAYMAPSLFYPGNWLFAPLPFNQAMAGNIVGNQLVAGCGMFLLVRSLGWGLMPALGAGFGYALSGTQFSWQNTYPLQATAAWFPMCLWSLRRLGSNVRRPFAQPGAFILATLSTFMLVSAGVPEIAVLCLVTSYGFCLAAAMSKGGIKPLVAQKLAMLSGLLLAMPQILPLMEWLPRSPRISGLQGYEALKWSSSWYDIAGFVLCQPLGDMFEITNRLHPLVLKESEPYLASAFLGSALLSCACWGLSDRSWHHRWWLLGLAIVAVMVSMVGHIGWLSGLTTSVSWLTSVRYPIKLLIFPTLVLVLLAARGLRAAADYDRRQANMIVAVVWLVLTAAGTWFTCSPESAAAVAAPLFFSGAPPTVAEACRQLGVAMIHSGTLGLIACSICWLFERRAITYAAFSLSLVAMLVGQLGTAACLFQRHPAAPDFFSKPLELAGRLHQLSSAKNGSSILRCAALYRGVNAPRNRIDPAHITESEYQYCRQMMVSPTSMDAGVAPTAYVTLDQTKENFQIMANAMQQLPLGNALPLSLYCRASATHFIFCQAKNVSPYGTLEKPLPELDPRLFDLLQEDLDWNVRIYQPKVLTPRAYLAANVQWGQPHEAVVSFVEGAIAGFDPATLTVLEDEGHPRRPAPPQAPKGSASGTVRFLRDTANCVELDVTAAKYCVLVLADEFFPGWIATIDGRQAPIYRANAMYRALFLEPGTHKVSFHYRPLSLLAGLLLASLPLLLMLGLLVFKLRSNVKQTAWQAPS